MNRLHHEPAACALLWLVLLAPLAYGAGGSSSSGGGTGHGGRPVTPGATHGKGHIIVVLPDGSLRELCTAFTQVTESPFTLAADSSEAGIDAVSASYTRLDTVRSHGLEAGGIGYTRGLPGRWDLGIAVTPWSGMGLRPGPADPEVTPAGFGGGTLKARHTFFGVDSEGVALGFVATLRVPGAEASPGTTAFEGALSLPVSASLPFDFTGTAMAQVGSVGDAADDGRHVRWIGSAQLEHDLAPHLSGWIEGVSVWDREPSHPWLGTVNAGISVEIGSHVSLGVGAAMGHSAGASDAGVFAGLGLHR